VDFFTLGILGVGIITGVIISLVALSKIKRDPERYGGREFAIAGLVTSLASVVTIVPVLLIAAIAIPNLLASRRAANEGSAIICLRNILTAETTYQIKHGGFATLDELAADELIPPEIASGKRSGYKFKVSLSRAESDQPAGFQAVCAPIDYPNSGRRSFY